MHEVSFEEVPRRGSRPQYTAILIDGELFKRFSVSVAQKSILTSCCTQQGLSMQDIQAIVSDLEEKLAYQFLIRQLARRAMTVHEASQLLARHYVAPKAQQSAVEKAVERGFLSDSAVVELSARKYIRQGKSTRLIRQKIGERVGKKLDASFKISEEISLSDSLDREQIEKLLETKYRRKLEILATNRTGREALIAALCRRGFSYELVKDVLAKHLTEGERWVVNTEETL